MRYKNYRDSPAVAPAQPEPIWGRLSKMLTILEEYVLCTNDVDLVRVHRLGGTLRWTNLL